MYRPPGPGDVFCLVKAFVSDPDLSQPPLLVLPELAVEERVMPKLQEIARGDCARRMALSVYLMTSQDALTTLKTHGKLIC